MRQSRRIDPGTKQHRFFILVFFLYEGDFPGVSVGTDMQPGCVRFSLAALSAEQGLFGARYPNCLWGRTPGFSFCILRGSLCHDDIPAAIGQRRWWCLSLFAGLGPLQALHCWSRASIPGSYRLVIQIAAISYSSIAKLKWETRLWTKSIPVLLDTGQQATSNDTTSHQVESLWDCSLYQLESVRTKHFRLSSRFSFF